MNCGSLHDKILIICRIFILKGFLTSQEDQLGKKNYFETNK